jgi:hypothetical protein
VAGVNADASRCGAAQPSCRWIDSLLDRIMVSVEGKLTPFKPAVPQMFQKFLIPPIDWLFGKNDLPLGINLHNHSAALEHNGGINHVNP